MKILIPTDNYYPNVNGASYFAQRHAHCLVRAGHDVVVIAPSRFMHDEQFEHNDVRIVGIRSIPFERIRIPMPLILEPIEHALRTFQPDIVHIQSHFAIARKSAALARKMGIPVIGTNHFMPENLLHYLPIPSMAQQVSKHLAWNYFLRTFQKLDAVTAPTKRAALLLKDIGLKKPIHVISNGIDLQRFHPINNRDYLRIHYRLSDQPILLFVGRLDKEKNLDFLIRSLNAIIPTLPLQCVIVGAGAQQEGLKNLTRSLGLERSITFLGFIADDRMPELYALADCFIMPGTAELQSIATMEAMASGLPIIAANAMALPELIQDGKNGLLFRPGDETAMNMCIKTITTNASLRETMSKSSFALIKKHDSNHTTRLFIELYERLIARNNEFT